MSNLSQPSSATPTAHGAAQPLSHTKFDPAQLLFSPRTRGAASAGAFYGVKKLGSGTFGMVLQSHGKAVKVFNRDMYRWNVENDEMRHEVKIASVLQHAEVDSKDAVSNAGHSAFVRYFLERTPTEAQLHPWICETVPVKLHPFLTMELCSEDMNVWKASCMLGVLQPKSRVLLIAGQLASALHFMTTLGIMHGDLKPANILVLDKKQIDGVLVPRLRIADFGTAVKRSNGKITIAPKEQKGEKPLLVWTTYPYAHPAFLERQLRIRPRLTSWTNLHHDKELLSKWNESVAPLFGDPWGIALMISELMVRKPRIFMNYRTEQEVIQAGRAFIGYSGKFEESRDYEECKRLPKPYNEFFSKAGADHFGDDLYELAHVLLFPKGYNMTEEEKLHMQNYPAQWWLRVFGPDGEHEELWRKWERETKLVPQARPSASQV